MRKTDRDIWMSFIRYICLVEIGIALKISSYLVSVFLYTGTRRLRGPETASPQGQASGRYGLRKLLWKFGGT